MKGNKTKSISKQRTNKVLTLLTFCALAITAIIISQFFILDSGLNILPEGTVINGYNLSGMSKEEASAMLINKFNNKAESFKLTINSDDKSWTFDKSDFSINSDIHTLLDASQLKAEYFEDGEKRQTVVDQFNKVGGSVNTAFNYMFVGLDEKIENIINEVEIEPTDSVINFNPENKKMFDISESKNGKRVNKEKLYNDINEQFIYSNNVNVELEFIDEVPAVTKEYNESLTKKITHFSTNVADSTGGRKHNVKLALKAFDGFILEPGKQYSFNEISGEHTIETGYKNAIIIYNGEFTDGIGGGVCQASTTLYNALLLSGVDIDEVHKHTLPVRYVPLALDAMISDYTSDLKFTNNTEYPMYIHTYSDENSVYVDIYSKQSEYSYKTRSETIDTIKATSDKIVPDNDRKYTNKVLFKGEYFRLSYPKDGYEAKAYLQKYLNGELIEEKEIRHEIYQPQKGVVIEGIEELPDGIRPIDSGVKILSE